MNRSTLRAAQLAISALAILSLSGGCASDPKESPVSPDPSTQEVLFIEDSGLADPTALPLGIGGREGSILRKPGFESITALVNGALGGKLQISRFVLIIPPGAFAGEQTITLKDTSVPFIECQLQPEGLHFNLPVTLSINLAGTTGSGDENATIYWYDPESGKWVDIGGSFIPILNRVATTLQHFSTYRPGRAGW